MFLYSKVLSIITTGTLIKRGHISLVNKKNPILEYSETCIGIVKNLLRSFFSGLYTFPSNINSGIRFFNISLYPFSLHKGNISSSSLILFPYPTTQHFIV